MRHPDHTPGPAGRRGAAVREPAMRRAAALLALLALPLVWPAWAQAHATLLATTPGAGTRVAAPPHQPVLTFDQQIRPVSGGTTVVDAAGKSVMAGPAASGPGRAQQTVGAPSR